jgi:murein DD-endopeptidase MepM/ murein hydrolase activator NlpD
VLDGSVLMSSYTATDGYVIVVQHVGNLVSIYKHLSSPMKHEGEKVKAGDVIGILGKKAGKPSHSYLHLELWHKGSALDPTQYISF